MKILFVCGGTAGHINPALAVANKFKERYKTNNLEILFAGTPDGMESRLVKEAGYDFASIEVKGISRKLTFKNIMHNINALKCLMFASHRAKKIIKDFSPDIILGTGGYVSYPVISCGIKMGIKTAIHEQNAFPGISNKALGKKTDIVFVAVKEAIKHFKTKNTPIVTGNPVRDSVIFQSKSEAKQKLGLDDKPLIYSVGGSLGAVSVNKIAADLIEWHIKENNVNHIHGYGKNGVGSFDKMLTDRNVPVFELGGLDSNKNIRIGEYIKNSDLCLAAADLVISRCGAVTISELQVTGKPSVLIPSPNVTENHQYYNGKVLSDAGAAILIEEKDYDKDKLISQISDLLKTPEKLKKMGDAASKMAILNTAEIIVDKMIDLL